MSQPSIPNMTSLNPINKKESISMLLSSIAMSEMAISQMINAEAEKMQAFVKHAQQSGDVTSKSFIDYNHSVSKFLEEITMEQWLNLKRLDRIIHVIDHYDDLEKDEFIEEYDENDEGCEE